MPARPRLGDEWMDRWTAPVVPHRGSHCRHRFGWGRCTGQGGLRNSGQLMGGGSPENGNRRVNQVGPTSTGRSHVPAGMHQQANCKAFMQVPLYLCPSPQISHPLPAILTRCSAVPAAAAAESQGSPAGHVSDKGCVTLLPSTPFGVALCEPGQALLDGAEGASGEGC